MKIVVSSNCQTDTVVEVLKVVLPNLHVVGEQISLEHNKLEHWQQLLADAEYLITSNKFCFSAEFKKTFPNVHIVMIPTIEFAAFHPDIVYVEGVNGELMRCLDSDYHSALVLWGWKNKLAPLEIQSLFCKDVFYRLGYLSAWDACVEAMRGQFELCGLDFKGFWRSVKRTGVFMYSLNHPKVHVIAEMVKQVALNVGASRNVLAEGNEFLLTDQLSAIRWPVYPEIAELYGVPGMYKWKVRKQKYLTLEDYINNAVQDYEAKGCSRDCMKSRSLGFSNFDRVLSDFIRD